MVLSTYSCLNKQIFKIGRYTIVPLRENDILDIMEWRNQQMVLLRQKKLLTVENQQCYYSNFVVPTFTETHPEQILFSYLLGNNCIGYGGLVHLNWPDKRGEVSFLESPDRTVDKKVYRKDFSNFLTLIKEVAFNDIGLHRLFTETFDVRDFHVSILEQNNFVLEGRLQDHVIIGQEHIDSLIHGCLNRN